jgi:hypothetical protein
MKNGIASKAKLSIPVAILSETVVRVGRLLMLISIVTRLEIPILKEIGTPSDNKITNVTTSTITSVNSIYNN